jgi:hypothetical protein
MPEAQIVLIKKYNNLKIILIYYANLHIVVRDFGATHVHNEW